MAGLFITLFVDKCTACQSHWKSDFGWHRFQKWAYSLALAWGIRGLKSLKRFWNTWWPWEAASRLVSLSNCCLWCVFFLVSLSRAYGLRGLSLYTSNDLTYNSIRFKKPLDSFWPKIQRKGSEDYLVMILADSCLEFILKKSKHREARLKHKYAYAYLTHDFQRHFTLNWLLFVNGNYCLCTCFTELYLFYWLLVVPLAIFIAAPVVSSRT